MSDLKVIEEKDEQMRLLNTEHLKGHFGATVIQKAILASGLTWRGLKEDTKNLVSKCLDCQRFNIGQHGFHPLTNLKASLPFDHLCLDVKNMVATKRGHTCYLLVVDVMTRFLFLKPLKQQTALAVARALLEIFCTIGFPRIIQSDNGSIFINEAMKEIVRISGIDHRLISAYHHRANGLAERNIRTTSDVIYKQLQGVAENWDKYLNSTQYFCNLKISEITGSSPFSLIFARKANELSDYSNVEENLLELSRFQERLNYMNLLVYPTIVEKGKEINTKRNNYFTKRNHIITDQFISGAVVMVKDETRPDKITTRYEGPFTVIRRNQGGAYILKGADGTEYIRPPGVLKLVHQDLVIPGLPGIVAHVDKILEHT